MGETLFQESGKGKPYLDANGCNEELLCFLDLVLQELVRQRDLGGAAPEFARSGGLPAQLEKIVQALEERLTPDRLPATVPQTSARLYAVGAYISERIAATAAQGWVPGIAYVAAAFAPAATPFWQLALLLAAAPAFDRKYERVYACLNDDPAETRATFGLAVAAYELFAPLGQREKLQFYNRDDLCEMLFLPPQDGSPLLACPLVVQPAVLVSVLGGNELAHPLDGFARLWRCANRALSQSTIYETLCLQLTGWVRQPAENRAVVVVAPAGAGKDRLVRAVAAGLGVDVLALSAPVLLRRLSGRETAPAALVSDLRREFALHPSLLCLEMEDLDPTAMEEASADALRLLVKELCDCFPLLWITTRTDCSFLLSSASSCRLVRLPVPTLAQMERLLQETAGDICPDTAALAGRLAQRRRLWPGEVELAVQTARSDMAAEGETALTEQRLEKALAACNRRDLSGLGEEIQVCYGWEDLVITAASRRQLQLAADHVKFCSKVYGDWGMAEKIAYGRGVCVLLYGPPGTGKTMAAQVLARETGLRLIRVNSSQLTSKYIGETQKNISRIFTQAKGNDVILFFDEADAIFGRRGEVRDANDRYANGDTAFLLQKIEEYDGMTVLSTNLFQNIDEAFRRRITYAVNLTMPDRALRERLWRAMVPDPMPCEALDYDFLSKFELSGSAIKSIFTSASFMAASVGQSLSMGQLVNALRYYQLKSGKSCTVQECMPYAALLET